MSLLPFQDWEGVPPGKRELLKTLIGSRCVLDFGHGSQELGSDPVHGQSLHGASRPRSLGGIWHETRPISEILRDPGVKKKQRKGLKVAREGVRARLNKTASSSSSSDDSTDAFKVGAHLMAPGARRACARRQRAEDWEHPPEKDPKARVRRHVGVVDEVCGEIQNFLRPDLQATANHEAGVMQEALANACQMDVPMILRPQKARTHSESALQNKEATQTYLSTLDGLSKEEAEVDGLIWESLSDYVVRLHAWCRGHMRDLVQEPLSEGNIEKIVGDADFPQGSSERHMALALDELLRGSGKKAPTIQKLMGKVKQTLTEENRKRRRALQNQVADLTADANRHLELDLDESETVETNEHLVEALKAQRGLMLQLDALAYNKNLPPVMPPCDQAVKEMHKVITENSNHLAQMVQWSTQEADQRVKELTIDDRESSFNLKEADQAVQAFLGDAGALQQQQPARSRKRGVARRALMACIRSVEQLYKHSSMEENDERLGLSMSTLMPGWGGNVSGKDMKHSYSLAELASLSHLDEEHISKELQMVDPLRKVETPDSNQRAGTPPERSAQDKSAEMLLQVHGTLIHHLRSRIAVFQRSLERMDDSLRVLVTKHAIKDVRKDMSAGDDELKKLKLELLQKVRVAQKVHRDGHNSIFELLKAVRDQADSYQKLVELRELHVRMERVKKRQEAACAVANNHEDQLKNLRVLFVDLMKNLSTVGVKDVRINMDKMKMLDSHASGREEEKNEAIQRTAEAFVEKGQAIPEGVLTDFLERGAEVSPELAKKVEGEEKGNDAIMLVLSSQTGASRRIRTRNSMPEDNVDGMGSDRASLEPRSSSLDGDAGAPRKSLAPRMSVAPTGPDSHRRTVSKELWLKASSKSLTIAGLRGKGSRAAVAESSKAVSWPSAFKGICDCSGQPSILANNYGVCKVGFLGELVADIGLIEPNRIKALPRYHDGLSSFQPCLEQLEAAANRILSYWARSGPVRVAGSQVDVMERRYLGERFKASMVRSSEGVVAAIKSMMRIFRTVVDLHDVSGYTWEEGTTSSGSPGAAASRTVLEPELRAFARCCVMKRACLALTAWHNSAAAALEALRHGANLHNSVVVLGQLLFSEQITPGHFTFKQSVYQTTPVDKASIVNIILRGVLDLQKLSEHLGAQEVACAAGGQTGATYVQLLQETKASMDVAARMDLVEPMPEEFYSVFRNYTHSLSGVAYPMMKTREDTIRAELEALKEQLRASKRLLQADAREGDALLADATRAVEVLTSFWRHEVGLHTEVHNGVTLRAWRARLKDMSKVKVAVNPLAEHDASFRPKAPTPAQLDDWAAVLRAERAVVGGFALADSERSALAWCLGSAAIQAQAEPLLIQVCSRPEDIQWGFEAATNMDLELRVTLGKFDRGVTYNEADYLDIEHSSTSSGKRHTVAVDAVVPRKSLASSRVSTAGEGRHKTGRSKSKGMSDCQDDTSRPNSGSERDSESQASEGARSPARSPRASVSSSRKSIRPGSKAVRLPKGLESLSEALVEGTASEEHGYSTTHTEKRRNRIEVMKQIVVDLDIEEYMTDWSPTFDSDDAFVESVCAHTTDVNLDNLLTKYTGNIPNDSTKPTKVHQLIAAVQENAEKETRKKRIEAMRKIVASLNIQGSESSWAPIFEDMDAFVERVCQHARSSMLDDLLTEFCGADFPKGSSNSNKVSKLLIAIQESIAKEKRITAMKVIVASLDIEGSESDWAPIYDNLDIFVERVCQHTRSSMLDSVWTKYCGNSRKGSTKPKMVHQLITAVQESIDKERQEREIKVMKGIVTSLDIGESETDWAPIYENPDTFVERVCQHSADDTLDDLLSHYSSKSPVVSREGSRESSKTMKVHKLMELAADTTVSARTSQSALGEAGEGQSGQVPQQPTDPAGIAAERQQAGPSPEAAASPTGQRGARQHNRQGDPAGDHLGGAAIPDAIEASEVPEATDAAEATEPHAPLALPEDGQRRPTKPLQRQSSKPMKRQVTKPLEMSERLLLQRASKDGTGRGRSQSSAEGGSPGGGASRGGVAGAGDRRKSRSKSQTTPADPSSRTRSGSLRKAPTASRSSSTLQKSGTASDLAGPAPEGGAARPEHPRAADAAASKTAPPRAGARGRGGSEAASRIGDAVEGDGELGVESGVGRQVAGSRSKRGSSSKSLLATRSKPRGHSTRGAASAGGPGDEDAGGPGDEDAARGDSETSGSEGDAAALAEVLALVSSGESSPSDADDAPGTPTVKEEALSEQEWGHMREELKQKSVAAAEARRQVLLRGDLQDVDNAVALSEEAVRLAEELLGPAPPWRAELAAKLLSDEKAGLAEALVQRARARAAAARAEAVEGGGRWARLINAEVPGVVYEDDPEVARLVADIFEARIVIAECDSYEARLDRLAAEEAYLRQRLEGISGIDLRLHVPVEKLLYDDQIEADLRAGLLDIGARQTTLDKIKVGLRLSWGSIASLPDGGVAELRGPPGAIAELQALDLSRLFVLRCQVDVLEHPAVPEDLLALGPEERAAVEKALESCEREKHALLEQLLRQRIDRTASVCQHFHQMSKLHKHILNLWKQHAERASLETGPETASFVEGMRSAMEELFTEWMSRKDELADTIHRLSSLQEYVGKDTDGELPPAVQAKLQESHAAAVRDLAAFQELQNSNVHSLADLSQLLDTIAPLTGKTPLAEAPSLKTLFAMVRNQAVNEEMERQNAWQNVFNRMTFSNVVDETRSHAEADGQGILKAQRTNSQEAEASTRSRLLGLNKLQRFLSDLEDGDPDERDAIAQGEVPKRLMGVRDLFRMVFLHEPDVVPGANAVDDTTLGTLVSTLITSGTSPTSRKSGGAGLRRLSEKTWGVHSPGDQPRNFLTNTSSKPIERSRSKQLLQRQETMRKFNSSPGGTRSKTDVRLQEAAHRRVARSMAVTEQVSFSGGSVSKLDFADVAHLYSEAYAEDDARRLRVLSQEPSEAELASDSELEDGDSLTPHPLSPSAEGSRLQTPKRSLVNYPGKLMRGSPVARHGSRFYQKTLTEPAGIRRRSLSYVRPEKTTEGALQDKNIRVLLPNGDDGSHICFAPDVEQSERLPRTAEHTNMWRIVNKARLLRKRRKQESEEASGKVVNRRKFDVKIEAEGINEDTIVVVPGEPDDAEPEPRKGLLDGEPRQGKINRLKDMLRVLRMKYREHLVKRAEEAAMVSASQAATVSASQELERELVREDLELAIEQAQDKLDGLLHAAAVERAAALEKLEPREPSRGRRAKRASLDTASIAVEDAPPRPRKVRLRVPVRLPPQPSPRQIGLLGNRRAITVAKRTRFSSPPRGWQLNRAEESHQERSRLGAAGANALLAKDGVQTDVIGANEPIGFIADDIVGGFTLKAQAPPIPTIAGVHRRSQPAIAGVAMLTSPSPAVAQDDAAKQTVESAKLAERTERADSGNIIFQAPPVTPPPEPPPQRSLANRRPPGWTLGSTVRTQRQPMASDADDVFVEGAGSRQPKPPDRRCSAPPAGSPGIGPADAEGPPGDADALPPLTPPKIVGSRYFQPRGGKELTSSSPLPPIGTYAPSSAREAIWHPDVLRRGPDMFGAGPFSARGRFYTKGPDQSRDNSPARSRCSHESDGEKYYAPRRRSSRSREPEGSRRGSQRGSASPSQAQRSCSPPKRASWSPSRRPSIKGGTWQTDRDLTGQRGGATWLPVPDLEGAGWYDPRGRRRGRRERSQDPEDDGPVEEFGSVLGSQFFATKTPGTKRQRASASTEPKAQLPTGPPNTFEELRMDRVWESLLQEVRPKARPAPEVRSPRPRSPRGHLEHGALQRKASPQGKIRRSADPGVQVRVLRPENPRLPVLGTPLSARLVCG